MTINLTSRMAKNNIGSTPVQRYDEKGAKGLELDSFAPAHFENRTLNTALSGALGVLPLVGAGRSLVYGIEYAMCPNGSSTAGRTASGLGLCSNVLGSLSLGAGLLSGNSMATHLGLGLLGVSGLAGMACQMLSDKNHARPQLNG